MVNNSYFAGPLRCTIIPHLCHFSMNACVCVHEVTSIMSDSFASPWTVAHQAPLFMGFSRQEYWSGLPCPSPGDPPDPETELTSLMSPALASGSLTTGATCKAQHKSSHRQCVNEQGRLCPSEILFVAQMFEFLTIFARHNILFI